MSRAKAFEKANPREKPPGNSPHKPSYSLVIIVIIYAIVQNKLVSPCEQRKKNRRCRTHATLVSLVRDRGASHMHDDAGGEHSER